MDPAIAILSIERTAIGLKIVDCRLDADGSLVIPGSIQGEDVVEIAANAFEGCGLIESIELPDSVLTIGAYAFAGCQGMTHIRLPLTIERISRGAFEGASNLVAIDLPPSVKRIEHYAFHACESLQEVTLPEGLEFMGEWSFRNTDLNRVMIPSTVRQIGGGCFSLNDSLSSIVLAGASPTLEDDVFADISKNAVVYVNHQDYGNYAQLLPNKKLIVDPVVSIVGEPVIYHRQGQAFQDPGAIASDQIDGDLEVQITGFMDVDVQGDYLLTYIASDKDGNTSRVQNRTVKVVDAQLPIITLLGDARIFHLLDETFTDAGAVAFDSQNSTLEVTVTGSVNTAQKGRYELTYSAVDASGREAISVIREVFVLDAEEPLLLLNGEASAVIKLDYAYNDPGAVAVDLTDGFLEVFQSGKVENKQTGSYTLHFQASDADGNEMTAERLVHVVDHTSINPVSGWGFPTPVHRFEVIVGTFSWQEAKEDAVARGGHLATIGSQEESAEMLSVIEPGNYWLGATDQEEEGTWTWVTGEAFDFENWGSVEPNGDEAENFLQLFADGTWNDFTPLNLDGYVTGYVLEHASDQGVIQVPFLVERFNQISGVQEPSRGILL